MTQGQPGPDGGAERSEAPELPAAAVRGLDAALSRRRLLQQAGAFALGSTILAACGSGSGGGGGSTAKTGGGGGGARQTLEVWDYSYDLATPYGKAARQIDQDFTKANPDIAIKRVMYPYGQYFTLVRTAMTRRRGPDVFSMFGAQFADEYRAALRPVDDLLTGDLKRDLLFVDDIRTGDTLLVMPYTAYVTSLRYNKALFRKAGLDPETPPATWAEFIDACEKLKASGTTPIAAGFKDGVAAEAYTFGITDQTMTLDELHKNYRREQPWSSEGYRSAVNYLVQLAKGGYFTKNFQDFPGSPNPINQFASGKAGMVLTANTEVKDIIAGIGEENLGVMRMPRVPNSRYPHQFLDASYNFGWGISTWTKKEEAARKYITFMLEAPQQETLFELSGSLPNNRAAKVKAPYAATQQIIDWIRTDPLLHYGVAYGAQEEAVFDRRIPQVLTGSFSVDAMIKEMDAVREQLGPVKA